MPSSYMTLFSVRYSCLWPVGFCTGICVRGAMEELEMSFRVVIAVSSKVGSETYTSGFNKLTGKTLNYDKI